MTAVLHTPLGRAYFVGSLPDRWVVVWLCDGQRYATFHRSDLAAQPAMEGQ